MRSSHDDAISARAYQIWESEGRPHGRHHDHWTQAQRDLDLTNPAPAAADTTSDPHPGMMGDGTEEQNLGQPGNPGAKVTEADVQAAFGAGKK